MAIVAGRLLFLLKKVAMRSNNYLNQHRIPLCPIHQCHHFIHDGAPANRTNVIKNWLDDKNMPYFKVSVSFLNLIHMENAWNVKKNKVQEMLPSESILNGTLNAKINRLYQCQSDF